MDERGQEARHATAIRRRPVALYVDRSSRQWVVQDPEGNFWALPSTPEPWDDRRPYSPAGEGELEPVPGHYKYMLGLPS